MFEFKHPNYYKELRRRNKSDQAISKEPATAGNQRSPGPGLKQQAIEETVPHCDIEEASSSKPQASSSKQQASSSKPNKVVDTIVKP
jgi:hypothetical protein